MRNIGLNQAITKTFAQNLTKLEERYKDVWRTVSNANYPVPPLPEADRSKPGSYSAWPKGSGDAAAASAWPKGSGGTSR